MIKHKPCMGIDVGVSGGIAIVRKNKVLEWHQVPHEWEELKTKSKSGRTRRRRKINIVKFLALLNNLRDKYGHIDCQIEKVGAMPNQGSVSGFNFGEAYGITKAMAQAAGFNVSLVRPQDWKKSYDFKLKDKGDSCILVGYLFGLDIKDHNICDAILIAFFGAKLQAKKSPQG